MRINTKQQNMTSKSEESLQYIVRSVKRQVILSKFQKPKNSGSAKNVKFDFRNCIKIQSFKYKYFENIPISFNFYKFATKAHFFIYAQIRLYIC
jgi:hypothetical protein